MKLYFASSCTSQTHKDCWRATGVRRLLFSYAASQALFKENADLYSDPDNEIIVDSGAFTAWTKGKPIDLDLYSQFCLRAMSEARAQLLFVNLDVIPGSAGKRPTAQEREDSARVGWENYERMRLMGIPVMHVFHQHERHYWLDRLAGEGKLFGVSPANDVSVKERSSWLCKVFEGLMRNHMMTNFPRTHGFGVTTNSLVEEFPFYQVDSTSWLAASLYGTVPVGTGRGIVSLVKRDAMLRAGRDRIGREAAKNFAPCMRDGYKFCTVKSLEAYRDLESYSTALWAARGVVWDG